MGENYSESVVLSKIGKKSIPNWKIVKKGSWKRVGRDFGKVPGARGNFGKRLVDQITSQILPRPRDKALLLTAMGQQHGI